MCILEHFPVDFEVDILLLDEFRSHTANENVVFGGGKETRLQ